MRRPIVGSSLMFVPNFFQIRYIENAVIARENSLVSQVPQVAAKPTGQWHGKALLAPVENVLRKNVRHCLLSNCVEPLESIFSKRQWRTFFRRTFSTGASKALPCHWPVGFAATCGTWLTRLFSLAMTAFSI